MQAPLPPKLPGQWRRWDTTTAQEAALRAAVQAFDGGEHGQLPTGWLKNEALGTEPTVRTYVYVSPSETVEGFYAMRMAEVSLSQKAQEKLAVTKSSQGAATILYAARSPKGACSGGHIVITAVGTALLAQELIGVAVLGFEPGDETVAEAWRKLGFKNSNTTLPSGVKRMWQPLD